MRNDVYRFYNFNSGFRNGKNHFHKKKDAFRISSTSLFDVFIPMQFAGLNWSLAAAWTSF